MFKKIKICTLISLVILLAGCDSSDNPMGYAKNAHGRGAVKIYIEESFKPLFDTSIYTFESFFPKANITPVYQSEGEIINAFFANKTKTITISRDFTKAEKYKLKKNSVEVRSDKIAEDAIALIIHPSNNDSLVTIDELKAIISGKQTTWKSNQAKINVVFDQKNSANFAYLVELCKLKQLPINVFAVHSNIEVINYVKNNPNALGVIGLNWISDQDDFDVLDFVNGLKVMSVAKDKNSGYFKPYAGFIYTREYPLKREIWMINKAGRQTLNSGFVLFMKGEKGQLIVQKSALVPANAPVRLIQLREE
jgi:phosphate transport system substrate-binding protein